MSRFCQRLYPISIEDMIEKGDPVRKMAEICDSLDYSELEALYPRRRLKFDPRMLFELLVFAYMNHVYSSREIELRCRTDIRFIWLLDTEPVPDHTTIARFQNQRLTPVIENLFYQFVSELSRQNEVTFRNVFVDGTKIEACANRYTYVWAKSIERFKRRLLIKINDALEEIGGRYGIRLGSDPLEALKRLLEIKEKYGSPFVYERGRRKSQLQKDCEMLAEQIEKLEEYDEKLSICGTRRSYSKTDIDATFMRMKEDHMKRGQPKPGYNVQIAVESEYIIGIGSFSKPADTTTLIPFLNRMAERTKRKIVRLIADAGYSSEENYSFLEENGIEAYIKPNMYETKKKKRFRKDIFRAANLVYDEDNDRYTCPNGKHLEFANESKRKSENGYETTERNYVCENCSGCPYREECFRGNYDNRKISVSSTYKRQSREAAERISTKEGIKLCRNRSIQVEGAFGVIKQDMAFRRFLTRGKEKTETQFFLVAFAFNVVKLWNRERKERFNRDLFPVQEA